MREIFRDGIRWSIREVDSTNVPGARRASCLIFECEGVVRRVWDFNAAWQRASDVALWTLLEASAASSPSGQTGEHAISSASVVADRARSLLVETELMRESRQCLRIDHAELSERCRHLRRGMRQAITSYAEALRADGVPPERAIVLLKSALKDGLGTCNAPGDATAEQLLHDGVDWAIDAYYGAPADPVTADASSTATPSP